MSRVRANSITNKNADGPPSFTHGAIITGVATATGFKTTGIVTAASFQGDGSALTGIDATALKDSGGSVKVQANSSGAVVTGMLTATGVLTYEDVTNVDAIGIVTAREGILVGAGKSVGIGTVTPGVGIGLEVHNTEATGTFINVKSKSNTLAGINFGDFEDDNIGAIKYSNGSNTLRIFANAGEKYRIGEAGQLGIGGATYGSAGQVLKSGGGSAAPTWGDVTSKVLQVKFKESTSSRYNATSGSWTKMDGSSGGLQESITPSAAGNTLLVMMYLSVQSGNGEFGGMTITVHDGSSYISMMGESGSSSYTAPASVLGGSGFNEHCRNATGGSLWWPVYLHGRHLTTNTSSHTINLYARMGNGDFYWGDNGAANSMIIWEIEGDIGN